MKKLIFILFLILYSCFLFSHPITKAKANQIANNFFTIGLKKTNCSIFSSSTEKMLSDSLPSYYIFNNTSGGWIIISGDDQISPIIAYNDKGSFEADKMNPTVAYWLSEVSRKISSVRNMTIKNNSKAIEWENAGNGNFIFSDKSVKPLINSTWDQSQYYNQYCPVVSGAMAGYDKKAPAGCVAIAVGQIMKYFNYPPKGIGNNSYYLNGIGQLSANFDTSVYNWTDMPDSLENYNSMEAKFIYDCGIAVNMDYGATGSSADFSSVIPAMVNNFGFLDSMELLTRPSDSIGNELWLARIKYELENNRPVLYSGENNYDGHAFICDGYDNSYPTEFHINWGWSGVDDGYFAIGALDPVPSNNDYHFDQNNQIITNIKPAKSLFGFTIVQPSNQLTFNNDTIISITLDVIQGSAQKFELFLNNIPTDSIDSAPYTFTLATNKLAIGQNSLAIVGFDGVTYVTDTINLYIIPSYWKLQKNIKNNTVEYISVVDSNTVWVTLSNNYFLTTVNGGITWNTGYINEPISKYTLGNIAGVSASTAYASMYNPNGNSIDGQAIFMTVDSGKTWSPVSLSFSNSFPDWIYFSDSLNGICLGDPYKSNFLIYTTHDGGSTWSQSSSPKAESNEFGLLNDFSVYNKVIWFGTSLGRIYKSFDNGNTWSVTDTSIFDNDNYYFIELKDSAEAIAYIQYGDSTVINRTYDAGKTWVKTNINCIPGQLNFIPGTDSIWINVNESTYISYDDAKTFNVFDNLSLNALYFNSSTIGWSSLYFQNDSIQSIYKWNGNFGNFGNIKIKFITKDNLGNPLNNVKLTIDGESDTTVNGQISINQLNNGGICTYSAVANGYQPTTGQFLIINDTTITLILNPSYNAIFSVLDVTGQPMTGIKVVCNDSILNTNNLGQATFSNLYTGLGYPYTVIYINEYIDFGVIEINDSNVYKNIIFVSDSYYQQTNTPNSVFPNPASSEIYIITADTPSEVKLFNNNGILVRDIPETSNLISIPVQDLPNGLYLLKLGYTGGSFQSKVLIRH